MITHRTLMKGIGATLVASVGMAQHLIVAGGLGCSILPVRFGMPPEIVILELN
jgi:predicted MPP superfamily phosphohydrolase